MNDSIGLYLNDIGKVPLLTAEDERELSRVIEAGREAAEKLANGQRGAALKAAVAAAADAKDRFIRSNLRLVVSIARRYPLPQGMDLLDLIQEGNLGLEHAVDKFDWRRGFKFSTYATFWIRQAIGRALDQKASLIRIPGDRSASLRAALRQASGDGETLDQTNAELHRLTTPVSLDKTVGDDGDATLGDLMANGDGTPEDHVMTMVDSDLLDELLGTLDTPGPLRRRGPLRAARRRAQELPRGRRAPRRDRRSRPSPRQPGRRRPARRRRAHPRRLTHRSADLAPARTETRPARAALARRQ